MVTEETCSNSDERSNTFDAATILEKYCQAQLAALPQGRGLRAATDLLTAIPAACRLGWTDMTVSAPELFRRFRQAKLIANCPADSDIPAALRLVASVCGLVTQRSARRWTVWFSRASDPDHELGASIRAAVTPAMLHRPSRGASVRSAAQPQPSAELEKLKAESNALRVTLANAQSSHNDLERNNLALVQQASSLRKQLADEQQNRAVENEQARRTSSELRTTKKTLTNTQAQLADLEETFGHRERRLKDLRADLRQVTNESFHLRQLLHDIAELFELEAFDATTADTFFSNVEIGLSDARAQTKHVATVCARVLDQMGLREIKSTLALRCIREGTSEGEFKKIFENPTAELLEQFIPGLENLRAEVAKEGIFLPPPTVTVNDLRTA